MYVSLRKESPGLVIIKLILSLLSLRRKIIET